MLASLTQGSVAMESAIAYRLTERRLSINLALHAPNWVYSYIGFSE